MSIFKGLLGRIFGHSSQALIVSKEHSPTQGSTPMAEALPVKSDVEWADDTQLKALAMDAANKITNWVIAHDLCELYSRLAVYNEGLSPENQISIDVYAEAGRDIAQWRAEGLHETKSRILPVNAAGSVALKGQDVLIAFGPTELPFQLRSAKRATVAWYVHNGIDTYLDIKKPDNSWQKVYFTGDSSFANNLRDALSEKSTQPFIPVPALD